MVRLIYLKIAKVAGTSIADLLIENCAKSKVWCQPDDVPFAACDLPDIVILANRATIELFRVRFAALWYETPKLLVLRDPVERFVSAYNYLGMTQTLGDCVIEMPHGPPGFDAKTYNSHFVHMTLPQLEAVTLTYAEIFADNKFILVAFENLTKDLESVLSRLGFEKTLISHKNKGPRDTKASVAHLTPKEVDLLQKHFATDCAAYQRIKEG